MTFSYGFIFFISNLVGTIVGVLFLVLSLHFFKNKDSHKKLIPIKCAFYFLIILEIIKTLFILYTIELYLFKGIKGKKMTVK